MKERILRLLTVKSLVTLTLTCVFAWVSLTVKITSQEFINIFTVIISFSFGTQHEKKAGDPT